MPQPKQGEISASLVMQDAIRWARARGVRVQADAVHDGVLFDTVEWIVDPNIIGGRRGISPIGAAILKHQPKISSRREAAMAVLGVSEVELRGIEYGLAAFDEPPNAIIGREARVGKTLWLHGFEVAVLLRLSLMGTKGDA